MTFTTAWSTPLFKLAKNAKISLWSLVVENQTICQIKLKTAWGGMGQG